MLLVLLSLKCVKRKFILRNYSLDNNKKYYIYCDTNAGIKDGKVFI